LECSALDGTNVEEAFLRCARQILTKVELGKNPFALGLFSPLPFLSFVLSSPHFPPLFLPFLLAVAFSLPCSGLPCAELLRATLIIRRNRPLIPSFRNTIRRHPNLFQSTIPLRYKSRDNDITGRWQRSCERKNQVSQTTEGDE
jgi:hypothetical protein